MPGRGCFIAVNLVLSLITAVRTAIMATSTALRTIVGGINSALRTAYMATSTALRTIVESMISALRTAIMAISTALRTIVDTIVFVIAPFVFCMVPLFLASELVRYVISDYKAVVAVVSVDVRAAVAVGVAIGSVFRTSIWLQSCIVDLFGHTIANFSKNSPLKFRYSEKATQFWSIFHL